MTTPGSKIREPKTTEEMVSGIRRQIKALEARAANDDPWVGADMATLATEMNDAVDRTVGRLRANGYTWSDIGFQFGGLSRQAAFNRWANKAATHDARVARTEEIRSQVAE
jgi:hypothetical protein